MFLISVEIFRIFVHVKFQKEPPIGNIVKFYLNIYDDVEAPHLGWDHIPHLASVSAIWHTSEFQDHRSLKSASTYSCYCYLPEHLESTELLHIQSGTSLRRAGHPSAVVVDLQLWSLRTRDEDARSSFGERIT